MHNFFQSLKLKFKNNFDNWNVHFVSLGGAFEGVEDQVSPFGYKRGEGIDAGAGEPEWIVNRERCRYDEKFEQLGPIDGKVTGACKFSSSMNDKKCVIKFLMFNH